MQAPSVAKALSEAPALRQKPKGNVTLSNEEQAALDGDAKFLESISENDFQAVKTSLDSGQLVNVADENGMSTVHAAIKGIAKASVNALLERPSKDDLRVLYLLVERGAYLDYADAYGKKPIHVAMESSDHGVPMAEYMLNLRDQAGNRIVDLSYIVPADGNTLIQSAAWAGNTEVGKLLLETRAFEGQLEHMNKQGQTVLHLASFRAPKTFVTLLIDFGCNAETTVKNPRRLSKDNAEVMAAAMGREDTANYLKSLNTTLNAVKFATKMKKGPAEA